MTADELKGIIQKWLDEDDGTHFGAFELRLEALVNDNYVGGGSGDAAIAIAEHAFRAGWDAAVEAGPEWDDLFHGVSDVAKEKAWGKYDPPEDIKALS